MKPARAASLTTLIAAAAAVLFFSGGCLGLTNASWRMRLMVNSNFNPEKGIYPSLDDHIFAIKSRFTGVMAADRFSEEIGFWIFLTEPHDPGKIPVVFVHGHWTGPPAFKRLAASLDRERFEPWFTYYPTGADLQDNASQFRNNLERITTYYDQKTVLVVAYSLGGLVTRQALRPANDGVRLPNIPLFIGIANPWGGSLKVRTGSRLFVAVESWQQFIDGSPFIKQLFDDPLPQGTALHMIYGVGGNDDFLPGRDDGVLSEDSLGRKAAVDEASSVTILEGSNHSSIITDDTAICKVNALLAAYADQHPIVPVK